MITKFDPENNFSDRMLLSIMLMEKALAATPRINATRITLLNPDGSEKTVPIMSPVPVR
jgi:hypothetical protein